MVHVHWQAFLWGFELTTHFRNNHLITLNQAKKWGENSATKLSSSGFNENNMLKSHQIEKRKNSFSSFGV
jgi:hypothetical protein